MEGNEWGVEERGGERFNKPCSGVFLSEREKDLRGKIPLQTLNFNSPNLGSFGAGGEGSGSTYFKMT